jgi:ABC-type multidrug transport system ATPase subunit
MVMGPSGSGKSTLPRMLNGLLRDAVRSWLKANPGVADKWTPVARAGSTS